MSWKQRAFMSGYKYFETRYYDAVANPDSGADSAAGATQAAAWDYNNEVLYDFGHGLSYLDYEQNLKSVEVDKTADGNITAVVELEKQQRSGRNISGTVVCAAAIYGI